MDTEHATTQMPPDNSPMEKNNDITEIMKAYEKLCEESAKEEERERMREECAAQSKTQQWIKEQVKLKTDMTKK